MALDQLADGSRVSTLRSDQKLTLAFRGEQRLFARLITIVPPIEVGLAHRGYLPPRGFAVVVPSRRLSAGLVASAAYETEKRRGGARDRT
ncbi:MAG: hypothetical protein ABW252_14430 [Polyangiales bacterium]